ncbi:MAG: alpha/beta hydrolase [Anaerolineae bacterium]|nr:alpha/beta hydrolase [Anaerolineae bacterium]
MVDSRVSMHEFGGHGPALHIAHANGFPPGSYRQLAIALADNYHVIGLPARPLWPGSRPGDTPTWRPMAGDVVDELEASGMAPVIGVGHSLGGVLTLWAAIDRPDLFRCVILVDPVILPPRWLWLVRIMRRLGLERRQPFVQAARRRRRTWPSRQACFDHYRDRALFARWPDAALWDYVNSVTEPASSGGVSLAYPPEWEAHLFARVPTRIWEDVPRLRVPALFLRGEKSNTFLPEAAARVARLLPAARHAEVAGTGHLLPMEKPVEVAALIRTFVRDTCAILS